MAYRVRVARPDDAPGISEWTRDTFAWGDYVAGAVAEWIADDERHVLVAVDPDDVPRAMCMVRMLSPTEGWLSAARVHPDSQRQGLGSHLNDASVTWVKRQGGRVVRLATEDLNVIAQSQVEKLGYRRSSTWVFAEIEGRAAGQPVTRERLHTSGRSDVDPAWMYWSTSELYEAARGLKASAWSWRRATVTDLERAASGRSLLHNPAGWTMIEHPEEGSMDVVWVASSPNEFPRMVAGIDSHAAENGIDHVRYWIPQTGWTGEALMRAGAAVSETLVYSKAV